MHYWADLQSVHGLRCYGNITRTQNVSEYMLVLALCLVRLVVDLLYNKLGFCGMLRTCCTVVRFAICRGLAVGVDLLYNISTCRDAVYLLYTVDLLWILLHSLLCNKSTTNRTSAVRPLLRLSRVITMSVHHCLQHLVRNAGHHTVRLRQLRLI